MFEIHNTKIDYPSNTLIVQFNGTFNHLDCLNYLSTYYPDIKINYLLELEQPNTFRNYTNCGSATFSLI